MSSTTRGVLVATVVAGALAFIGCGSKSTGQAGSTQQQENMVTRFASLDSAQETTGSTSTATGGGLLAFDPSTRKIAGFVVSTGVTGTGAHIHAAARGAEGGIIVPLQGGPEVYTVPDGATLPEADVADFEAGRLYFNIHSAAQPEGEIRGQLDFTPTQTRLASLDGAQETPPNESAAKGGGVLGFDSATGKIAGFVVSEGVAATAAHIHAAARGSAGGVIVPLVGGPKVFAVPDGATLPAADIAGLDAGNLYYNLHSDALPEGEIRGQLDLSATTLRFASLDGAQEVPPNESVAKGGGVLAFEEATGRIAGFVASTGVTGVAAHIHPAPRTVAGPIIVPLTGGPSTYAVPDGATLAATNVQDFNAGNLYFNIHSAAFPEGEIRGQVDQPSAAGTDTSTDAGPDANAPPSSEGPSY